MKVLSEPFKTAIRGVRAAGKGGFEDEQRVIVRAEPGRLVLVGIGTEKEPGTETACPLRYDGEPTAIITSLVGLRWIAGVLRASDEVDLSISETLGLSVSITSWRYFGREAVLGLHSTSRLAPRQVNA